MFKRSALFVILSFIAAIGLFALFSNAAVHAAMVTKSAGDNLAAECNPGGGTVLAFGMAHVPAGEAQVSRLPNGDLRIANIGPSGLDGVCSTLTQTEWAARMFSPAIPFMNNGARFRWIINGVESGGQVALSDLLLDYDGETVALSFNEGLATNQVKMIAELQGIGTVIGDIGTGSQLLDINGIGGPVVLAGTDEDKYRYCLTCTLPVGDLPPFTLALAFESAVKLSLPGSPGQTWDADKLYLMMDLAALPTMNNESLEFANIGDVTITGQHYFVNGLEHVVRAGRFESSSMDGPVSMTRLGDLRNTLSTNFEGCLTCTLPAAAVGMVDFLPGMNWRNIGEQATFDITGTINGATGPIGSITFERNAANKIDICGDFAYPAPAGNWRLQVIRNGNPLLTRNLPDGDCFTFPRNFRLEDFTIDLSVGNYVFFSNLSLGGGDSIELLIGPSSLPFVDELELEELLIDTNVDYTAQFSQVPGR